MLGFFHEEPTKVSAHRLAAPTAKKGMHIPIHTMQEMNCKACPSDDDRSLRHAKMEPMGKDGANVYILQSAPSIDEDKTGDYLSDRAGDALWNVLSELRYQKKVRINATVRCYQGHAKNWRQPEVGPTECCRRFQVQDIEQHKPKVIIGIGDAALAWATGHRENFMALCGTMFAVKIGRHVCWFMPVAYPNFAYNEKRRDNDEYALAFKHYIRRAVQAAEDDIAPPVVYSTKADYERGIELITGQSEGDMARLETALHSALRNRYNGLDYETSGLRPWMQREPHIWTAAVGSYEHTVAFSVDHPEGWGTETRMRRVRGLLGEFLMQSGPKICHNLAFEMEWTNYFYGDEPLRLTEWEDTMALAHTLNEQPGAKGLGIQTLIHFGFDVKKQSNVDASRLLDYPLPEVLLYNGMDTKWTHKHFTHVRPIVAQRKGDDWEYERKVRLAPTLVLTQAKGMPVDVEYAKRIDAEFKAKSDEATAKLLRTPEVQKFERKFGTFRVGNTDDDLKLMKMLERPEIEVEERGKTRMTTDASALSSMPAKEVPSAGLILEVRGIEKLRGTYIVPAIEGKYLSPLDGWMRCQYGHMVAVTGRLNSEDPNLQNFPKRKHREVRGMVYAPDGFWIAALDYGQIEARVFAMASEDEALMRALWTGYDIHGYWADWFLKKAPEWADYLSSEFSVKRDDAKGIRKTARDHVKNRWVFPQFFGSAVESCANNLHLDVDVARAGAEQFWDEFRGVKRWQEKLMRNYEKNLYVETLTGRRERGPLTKNQILNQPIQGTAADIVTTAMNVLSEMAYEEKNPELQPNLNVHDDLTFLLSDDGVEAKMERIARVMCTSRYSFINVPLIVEAAIGSRWHELEKYADFRSDELFNQPNPFKEAA